MKRMRLIVAAALVVFCGALPIQAATVQGAGDNWVGVQAENFDSVSGTQWITVSKSSPFTTSYGTTVLDSSSNALGGEALMTNHTGSAGYATYDFVFDTPGTYYVYGRYSVFEGPQDPNSYGNEDSLFVGDAWNTPTSGTNAQTWDLAILGHVPADGAWEGTYRWGQVKGRDASGGARAVTTALVVDPSDVGETLTLYLRNRELGASIDYLLLSTTNNLDAASLEALAIPEPASLGMLVLAAVATVSRRRPER